MSDTKKAHQPEPDYLAIGKLRREVTIVGQGTKAEVKAVAEDAVKDGRASEVWLVPIEGYYSESSHGWNDERLGTIDNPGPAQGERLTETPKGFLNTDLGDGASNASADEGGGARSGMVSSGAGKESIKT